MAGDDEEEKKEEPKIEEVKEEEPPSTDPLEMAKRQMENLKNQSKNAKKIDLNSLEEGLEGESIYEEGTRHLLKGFRDTNIKIHLLAD